MVSNLKTIMKNVMVKSKFCTSSKPVAIDTLVPITNALFKNHLQMIKKILTLAQLMIRTSALFQSTI